MLLVGAGRDYVALTQDLGSFGRYLGTKRPEAVGGER